MRKFMIALVMILAITITGCTRVVKETATEEYRTVPGYFIYIPHKIGNTTIIVPYYYPEYKERKYIIVYSDGTTEEVWRSCDK